MLKTTTRDQEKKWRKSLFDVAYFILPPYEADITHTSWQMPIAIKVHIKMKWIKFIQRQGKQSPHSGKSVTHNFEHCAAQQS